MPKRHVVVDGSNIATEGRSLPSLAQLDEAVQAFQSEYGDAEIVVVVDATFGHRIDEKERKSFQEAEAAGEIVSPPAGAIGRGDAFLLRIAEKTGATVLSNDSFQEFHGEHEWLFEKGRLIGGKPVQGVGWIFTDRSPVRGPKSRVAVRSAKKQKAAAAPAKTTKRAKKVDSAIAVATSEAIDPAAPEKPKRRRRSATPPADPLNEPLAFIQFVAAHPLGSTLEGVVESFSSHGAFVTAGGARCYIPLSGMGNPPPRAARQVMTKGETRKFKLQALDPARRGIELALPRFARVSGQPTAETVEAEIAIAQPKAATRRRKAATKGVVSKAKGPARKAAAKKATKKAPAPRKTAAKKSTPARSPAKKATKKAPAKTSAKKATAGRPTSRATAKTAARKTPAKKTTVARKPAAARAKKATRSSPAKRR